MWFCVFMCVWETITTTKLINNTIASKSFLVPLCNLSCPSHTVPKQPLICFLLLFYFLVFHLHVISLASSTLYIIVRFIHVGICVNTSCLFIAEYSWNSSTLATSCEELTHWKRPWCWEGLGAGRERDDRGWDS